MHLNYGKCVDCGDEFLPGQILGAKVLEANPEGDSIVQFVHQVCPPTAPSTAPAPARPPARRNRGA